MWVKISTLQKKRVNFDSVVSLKRAISASKKRIIEFDRDLESLDRLLELINEREDENEKT